MSQQMNEMATAFGRLSNTVTKVERFGWTIKDAPGVMTLLDKKVLQIHQDYQRQAIMFKIRAITTTWSWVACGAIIVGKRCGEYWVIDGQHRVLAAQQRADIAALPCLVFETESVQQEARGFLDANGGRKPISSIDKFRASIAAGDETAQYVSSLFDDLGITPQRHANKALEIRSVTWAMSCARENREAFEVVMRLAAEMCQEIPICEMLLGGLYYLQTHSTISLRDKRLRDRLKKIGVTRLIEGAKRAAAYFTKGGAKVWANGMLEELNKGLRDKITIRESTL